MAVYVVLLRAINVGGTGMLSMKDLAELCFSAGLQKVRTYIQSGNIIVSTRLSEQKLRSTLESVLFKKMGKKVDVIVRSSAELVEALGANPFPDADPAKVAILFFPEPPTSELVKGLLSPGGEQMVQRGREIYIHYPVGMGKSKLKLPKFEFPSTARNINTVTKLAEMLKE